MSQSAMVENSYQNNITNFNESPSKVMGIPFYTIIISANLYVLIFLVGLFGNLLVIFIVIRNKFLQQNTNYCLVNLSIADLLLLLVCMPSAFIDLFSEEIWHFGYALCILIPWLENFAVNASVLTIACICMERYLAVTKPLLVKLWAYKFLIVVIVLIWLISFLLAAPYLFISSFETEFHSKYQKNVTVCYAKVDEDWKRYYLYTLAVVFYIVPCVLLFIQYGKIICILKETHYCKLDSTILKMSRNANGKKLKGYKGKKGKEVDSSLFECDDTYVNKLLLRRKSENLNDIVKMSQLVAAATALSSNNSIVNTACASVASPQSTQIANATGICTYMNNKTSSLTQIRPPNKQHKQTVKMLFLIMILFFVCILPYRIYSIWIFHLQPHEVQSLGIEKYHNILSWTRIMFYLNSAINPILYHLMSTKFQAAFINTIYNCPFNANRAKRNSQVALK